MAQFPGKLRPTKEVSVAAKACRIGYFCQVRFLCRLARSCLRRLCLLILLLRLFFSDPI